MEDPASADMRGAEAKTGTLVQYGATVYLSRAGGVCVVAAAIKLAFRTGPNYPQH